jgi:hypothetical protein
MRRNLAGDIAGPERECMRGDGQAKKVFVGSRRRRVEKADHVGLGDGDGKSWIKPCSPVPGM